MAGNPYDPMAMMGAAAITGLPKDARSTIMAQMAAEKVLSSRKRKLIDSMV